jgi:hypothetical protein
LLKKSEAPKLLKRKEDDLKGLVDTTDYTKVEEPNLNIDIESLPKK